MSSNKRHVNINALQFIVRSYSNNAGTFSDKHPSYLHQIFACTIAGWFVMYHCWMVCPFGLTNNHKQKFGIFKHWWQIRTIWTINYESVDILYKTRSNKTTENYYSITHPKNIFFHYEKGEGPFLKWCMCSGVAIFGDVHSHCIVWKWNDTI
jgi:hypothetical protein